MNYLPWLKSGSHGGRIRQLWKSDVPLQIEEGGSTEALTPARFQAFNQFFQEGKTLTGLVCLTQLGNEFDSKLFVQDPIQIEKLARILFTDGQAADANPHSLLSDEWYSTYNIRFPTSLSEKETIPVVVRDLSKIPAHWRMLGMCEWVSAFWKIIDRVGKMQAEVEGDIGKGGLTPEQETDLRAKADHLTALLAQARATQRNVVASVTFCASSSDQDFENLVVAKRENISILRDFAGIQGWNFIQLVGTRRGDIMKASTKVTNEMVISSFKGVTWSTGRVLTPASVDKILTVYNTVRKVYGVQACIQKAFAYWGRNSPLEQYSILLALLSMGKNDAEVLIVVQSFVLEKLSGTCESLSKNEILKPTGLPNNWITRQKVVAGALRDWVMPAKDFLGTLPRAANTDALITVMTTFGTMHQTFEKYSERENGGMTPAMREALPTWVSVDLRNFLQNIYRGRRDCYWAQNLSKPPRGGLKAVVWDGCLKECLAKEVKKIDDAFDEWKKLLTPKQVDEDGRSELTKAIADLGLGGNDGGIAPADETGPATTFANIRREIQDQASTYKSHWFTLMPVPQAAPDAIRLVQGSGAWQNTQADSRVAFIYALNAAYDRETGLSWRGDRQYSVPL